MLRIRIRTILLGLLATLTLAAPLALAAPASAHHDENCAARYERDALRLGMSPQRVHEVLTAKPWLKHRFRDDGKRYLGEIFNDCNTSTNKEFIAVYRIREDGTKHLFMHRYMNID